MSNPVPLTNNWARGRVTDIAPERMPANSALVMQNYIPDRMNAALALRGAWSYAYTAHADFTFFSGSSVSISAIGWMPFSDGVRYVAIDQAGRILQVNGSGVGSLLDATGLAEGGGIPFWHRDRMILPGSSGTKYPWQITSNGSGTSTAAAFSGNVPKAKHGASWQTVYLLLSNGGDPFNSFAASPRTTWVSDPGALTFTTGHSFEWPDEILRTVPITAGIMGFGYRRVWLCTGTVPPGTASANLVINELYNEGTSDPKSVAQYKDYCVWANSEGVWMSDSTSLVDVTSLCGLGQGWRQDMQQFGSGWTLAGGMHGNFYIVTACNAGVEQFTYAFDLVEKVGFNLIGFPACMYATVQQPGAPMSTVASIDLLFASTAVPQVGRVQPCFSRGTTSGKDANGVVIPYQLVTAPYMMGIPGEKRLRRTFITHFTDVTAPYTDSPELAYSVTDQPISGFVNFNSMTYPASSGRQMANVNDRGRWIVYRIRNAQAGTAGTRAHAIMGLEQEGHALEKSKNASS